MRIGEMEILPVHDGTARMKPEESYVGKGSTDEVWEGHRNLLDAEIHSRRPEDARSHAAADFLCGPLTTALEDDEVVTEIVLPGLPPHTGWGFEEVALRQGDFAIAAVAIFVALIQTVTGSLKLLRDASAVSRSRPNAVGARRTSTRRSNRSRIAA